MCRVSAPREKKGPLKHRTRLLTCLCTGRGMVAGVGSEYEKAFGTPATLRNAAWVNAQCTSQSIASFEEHIRLNRVPSHTHGATHILATGGDNSPFGAAHERAKAKGWKTRTVTCGHEVMLDLPSELTDLLLEFVTSAVPSPSVA